MKRISIIALMLAFLLVLCGCQNKADEKDNSQGNKDSEIIETHPSKFSYYINEEENYATIYTYYRSDDTIVVPEELYGFTVKKLSGPLLYKRDNVTTVYIPDTVTVTLPMNIHFIEANPSVQENSGRYAVTRDPIVYCMEGIDNGENLRDITLLEGDDIRVETENGIPAPVFYIPAERRAATNALYSVKSETRQSFTARLIPYFSFSNRGSTDLLVWTMAK